MKNLGAVVFATSIVIVGVSCSGSEGDGGGDGDGDGVTGDGGAAGDGDAPGVGGTTGDGDIAGDGDTPGVGGSIGDGDAPGVGGTNGDGDVSGAGGAVGDGDAPGVTDIPPVDPVPSGGCGTADPPSGPLSMMVGDLERTYIVSLPDGYDASNAYPLIFAFHGLGGSAELVSGAYYFGLEQTGGTPSIFVYPDGMETDGSRGWPNEGGRDVDFFDALLASVKTSYCVDEKRVFSTGHSYGGMMTFTLACERATDLRAVAPVAGARFGGQGSCSGPVAILGIHGENDETVDYDQGLSATQRVLDENGCDEASSVAVDPTEFCTSYSCNSGYPSVWCKHQDGHNWPNFAADAVKAFFDRF